MSAYVIHATGMITDDGKTLMIDYPDQLKADYIHLAGHAITIEIRKLRSKRSLKQNAWLHAAIKPLADELGNSTEELKLILLGQTFGWREIRGASIPNRLHTSELNTEEFGELMDTLLNLAAENSVVILLPDEFRQSRKKQLRRGAATDRSRSLSGPHVPDRSDRDGVSPSTAPTER